MEGDNIQNIQHVQTVMLEEDIKKLKDKTHKQHTKDALTVAVEHYLNCNCECKDKVKEVK